VSRRGITLSLAAAAGELLAAAFVSTAVASADIVGDLFTPDTSTFDPTTGTEDWNDINLLDASQDVVDGFTTKDTVETLGSIVNNCATVTASTTGPEVGSHIDYLTIGGGSLSENEFVIEPGGESDDVVTIGGGFVNVVSGVSSEIGGGSENFVSNESATIGGGFVNVVSGVSSEIGGGSENFVSNESATIGGGFVNVVSGVSSEIGGGSENFVSNETVIIAGGFANEFVYESGVSPAITDLLVTPFGDVTLLG
jgi:hypothetical protein